MFLRPAAKPKIEKIMINQGLVLKKVSSPYPMAAPVKRAAKKSVPYLKTDGGGGSFFISVGQE